MDLSFLSPGNSQSTARALEFNQLRNHQAQATASSLLSPFLSSNAGTAGLGAGFLAKASDAWMMSPAVLQRYLDKLAGEDGETQDATVSEGTKQSASKTKDTQTIVDELMVKASATKPPSWEQQSVLDILA